MHGRERSPISRDSSRSVPDSENRADVLITPRSGISGCHDASALEGPGVVAVFGMTRAQSLRDLTKWIDGVRDSVGPVPVYALGNKTDLTHRREVNTEDASTVLASYECPVMYTSAKTGENVEQAFQGLAKTIVESTATE